MLSSCDIGKRQEENELGHKDPSKNFRGRVRGNSLVGLSSGFMLGHGVRGSEVNGDLYTADVLYNISEECID